MSKETKPDTLRRRTHSTLPRLLSNWATTTGLKETGIPASNTITTNSTVRTRATRVLQEGIKAVTTEAEATVDRNHLPGSTMAVSLEVSLATIKVDTTKVVTDNRGTRADRLKVNGASNLLRHLHKIGGATRVVIASGERAQVELVPFSQWQYV